MPKIIVSYNEAVNMIKQHLNAKFDADIIIEPQAVEDGWIDVPKGWSECNPPPQAREFDHIDVVFDDGAVDHGRPGDWAISWSDNWETRIVKFRKLVAE